jgi:hypothetical protein
VLHISAHNQRVYLDIAQSRVSLSHGVSVTKANASFSMFSSGSRVTDSGVAHLRGVTALQHLDLGWCESVTDSGVAHLRGLTALLHLALSRRRCKRFRACFASFGFARAAATRP